MRRSGRYDFSLGEPRAAETKQAKASRCWSKVGSFYSLSSMELMPKSTEGCGKWVRVGGGSLGLCSRRGLEMGRTREEAAPGQVGKKGFEDEEAHDVDGSGES